jgi:hypothetical protein
MMRVPYEAILVLYVQREWENRHKKNSDRTGKYIEKHREWENGHTRMKK